MTLSELQSELAKRRATITVKLNVGTVPVFFVMVVGVKTTGSCSSESLEEAVKLSLESYDLATKHHP